MTDHTTLSPEALEERIAVLELRGRALRQELAVVDAELGILRREDQRRCLRPPVRP